MPTNTEVTSAIQAQTVPPDRNCPTDGQAVVDLVQDFCTVVSTTSQTGGGGTSDSVAQQALQQSAIALATAQQALAAVPNQRTSGAPIAVATGDSLFSISWTPAFNDTNYEVRVTFYGPATFATQFYGYMVVDGSRTVNGCQLRLDNMPANAKISWIAESL